MKRIMSVMFLLVSCKSAPSHQSEIANVSGYENNRRMPGANGMPAVGSVSNFHVTGRTSMGGQDPNQCEAAYSGNEKVAVTYTENGVSKNESLYIAGVNNKSFFGTKIDLNGKITDACGTVVEVTFTGNGKSIKQRFVVVDRIYEGHAQEEDNLDIAKEAYYAIRNALGIQNNFYAATTVIAAGSYRFAQNQKCQFIPGQKSPCGNGW
jgi:hypothetical protein